MPDLVPFENAVDLLDADHKAVKKMFIDYNALCEDGAPAAGAGERSPRRSARRSPSTRRSRRRSSIPRCARRSATTR